METHLALAFFLLWVRLSVLLELCVALDSIRMNQSISDNETLVSTCQTFELGFFTPGSSKNKYLGIWYKKTPQTVVWVANRNNPITDSYGVLTINNDGALVLLNQQTKSIIWSPKLSRAPENPVAQLLETGNLVLRNNVKQSSDSFPWQSFDCPSDTLLPGMKLGWNLKTGLQRNLTSWRSADDPSLGDFSYRIDIEILPHLVLGMGSSKKVRSGPWNGIAFNGFHVLHNLVFEADAVENEDEVYVLYESRSNEVISRLTMNSSGFLQPLILKNGSSEWAVLYSIPDDPCENYGRCGANGICSLGKVNICRCLTGFIAKSQEWQMFNISAGCTRRMPLDCQSKAGFVKVVGLKFPDLMEFQVIKNMSLEECHVECSNNCSCTAYAKSNINGNNSCLMWFGDLIDMRELTSATNNDNIYIRVHASEQGSITEQNKKRLATILVVSTISGIFTLGLAVWVLIWKKRTLGTDEESKENLELPLFDLATIATATNNFSTTNRIGEGGFGSVYKGNIITGLAVAVKRLSKSSEQGVQEFKNEAVLIVKLQHKNLVKLLGCCIQGEERMLIYEYMSNKSLDYFIFDQNRRTLLSWDKRFNIVLGVARGLLYLHQDSRLQIIHRDLKGSNILPDDNLNPKISDFGLARNFGENEMEARTKKIVGTHGYMSPEYVINGNFSIKSDIFSFGVLLLETLSGKRNRGFSHPDHHHNLLGHAWLLWNQNKALALMDACLEDSCVQSQLQRCLHVGLLCVQNLPADRPEMSSVVFMLSNEEAILPQPKHPGFFTERSSVDIHTMSGRTELHSQNAVTITLPEVR